MGQRVLVVEDDTDTAHVVRAYLERDGFEVEVARDGVSGLERALTDRPDLVVLDWMLPGLDGLSFLRTLRRDGALPVIMLTARTEEGDRIAGLEAGADDYVAKPFSPRELSARVRAVLRRAPAGEEDPRTAIEVAGLRIDGARRSVDVHGRALELSVLEFDLLATLAGAPGRVFTRDELIERVWGPDFTGVDRVVDVHVSNLRQKLEGAGARGLVGTVRGVGYRLEAP
jgi:two-component system, OmpR family, alkaline phosphatase synthesis response regulator PhoP